MKQTWEGLTSAEVSKKQAKEGYNELQGKKSRNFLNIMVGVITEPMFILLVACGTLYMILGDLQEGFMLLGFVVMIMGIEFFQERKSERALNALKDLATPRALVIRNGEEIRIPGREVVTGDLLVLQEGDRIPADATVLECVSLQVDESLLTGESVPVRKHEYNNESLEVQPGGDDLPFVYSGSVIVQGNGLARVNAIGMQTQIGKIGKALENVEQTPTKLKIEIGKLVKKITILGAVLFLVVVLAFYFIRGSLLNGILAGLTLAMAMLPEEFPVVLTVFMVLGAWRISKRNVLTRQPAAIENLGSATVLCTDKTGTLTENRMVVTQLYNKEMFWDAKKNKGFPEEFHNIIEFGILSSQTNPFDPMEKAIVKMGSDFLSNTEHIHDNWDMVREYPLSREMMAMSRVFTNNETSHRTIAAKGAPEAIFDLCHLPVDEMNKYADAVQQMAASGLRVLGVAKSDLDDPTLPKKQHDYDFEFLGLIGLSDPIRKEVPNAVKECHRAGIRVIMITGDYPATALNIAKEIGLTNSETCITGQDLNNMSDEELCERIKTTDVFARVIPEQKLKIVNALQNNQEVVAMTGDGVNDSPALKAANIGIAMGKKGTDVAREASDLVLMDDNFESIVGAIRMGRRIFDNLQKSLGYIFAVHVPIAGLSLIPVFFGQLPLILWPVHVVIMELIIDPSCSIIFEAEAAEKNVMNRPPRNIKTHFFGSKKILASCFQGLWILVGTLGIYFGTLALDLSEGQVRAMTFVTLITANIFTILTNRSWTESIFSIMRTPNSTVKWVAGGAMIFLALVLYIPFLQNLFKFAPLTVTEIVISILVGALTITWFELFKCNQRQK